MLCRYRFLGYLTRSKHVLVRIPVAKIKIYHDVQLSVLHYGTSYLYCRKLLNTVLSPLSPVLANALSQIIDAKYQNSDRDLTRRGQLLTLHVTTSNNRDDCRQSYVKSLAFRVRSNRSRMQVVMTCRVLIQF